MRRGGTAGWGARISKPDFVNGGKRQFLSRLDQDLILRIKMFALRRGTTASVIVDEVLRDFLARHDAAAAASEDSRPRGSP
jgi:hypothetical protein